MVDQIEGRTGRSEDGLFPLIGGLVALAAAGPALFAALTQWVRPRLSAGGAMVSLSLAEWWDRNWWLAAFWVVEIAVLLAFLAWTRRRRRRRARQLDAVAAGLARVLPLDWDPARHLRVLRWRGHLPVRLRLDLTPRSPLGDRFWRESVTDAARTVLGSLAPVSWPTPPRGGVFDWARRPPQLELRTAPADAAPHPAPPMETPRPPVDDRTSVRLRSAAAEVDNPPPGRSPEDLPIYRRPRPAPAGAGEPMSTQHGRED